MAQNSDHVAELYFPVTSPSKMDLNIGEDSIRFSSAAQALRLGQYFCLTYTKR